MYLTWVVYYNLWMIFIYMKMKSVLIIILQANFIPILLRRKMRFNKLPEDMQPVMKKKHGFE